MKYIAPKDVNLASTCGLSIELKKGIATLCPPDMHDDLLAAGCVPETDMPEPEAVNGVAEPRSKDERKNALHAAFMKISLRNERDEFNAVGVPHTAVLARELGWSVNAKERDAAWSVWQQEGATA